MAKHSEPWSSRQQRQLSYISEFTTDIRYIKGEKNSVADALSRAIITSIQLGIDYDAMAAAQRQDAEVQACRNTSSNFKLADVPFGSRGVTLLCDTSTGHTRPIVPECWRRKVFDIFHGLSHPSIRSTRKIISSKFVWNGLQKQVGQWAKQCLACQSSKVQTHVKAPLNSFRVPGRRFDHIHVDLVGPLPPSGGFTHLFTIIDRFSRWPEAVPLNDTSAVSCARVLVANWIARFGIPSHITSDRGPQFTSQLWTAVAQLLGTKLHHTTAYHPQSNGLVERFHRHLKSALRARLSGPSWTQELPWVLLGIRTTPKEDLGCSSAELVYGYPLTVPGEFVPEHSIHDPLSHLRRIRDTVRSLVPVPTSQHGAVPTAVPGNLHNAKYVFIRRDAHHSPLQRPYEGPFRVVQSGPKTFQVDVGGRVDTISIDRLKPAYLDPEQPIPDIARRPRGRPRQPSSCVDPSTSKCTRSGRAVRPPRRYISVLGGVV